VKKCMSSEQVKRWEASLRLRIKFAGDEMRQFGEVFSSTKRSLNRLLDKKGDKHGSSA